MSNYNQEVIEISDDEEQTYYGSDFSISEDSDDDSIQFICEIKPNSTLKNLQAPKTICKDILLEILQKMTQKNHKRWNRVHYSIDYDLPWDLKIYSY